MASKALEAAVGALFADIDVEAAERTLKARDIGLEFSTDAVNALNAEADALAKAAGKLKAAEAPRSERLEVRHKVDELVNARAFLYRLRPAQPGDVTAEVGGAN